MTDRASPEMFTRRPIALTDYYTMDTGESPATFTPIGMDALNPSPGADSSASTAVQRSRKRTPRYDMASYQVSMSMRVGAPPAKVYAVIADYHEGHRQIVPPKYFGPITIEEGGVGDGTVISFTMRVLGQARAIRAQISEPAPGRQMVERDLDTGVTTVFDVIPASGGTASDVTITTMLDARKGLGGAGERTLTRWLLPRIFRAELERLKAYVER